MVPTWKLAWHQGYSYTVKSCSLVHVSSIIYVMSQEALNQQGRLYSPVGTDPVGQEFFPPLDVSALTPRTQLLCVASRASLLVQLLFAFLFVPAEVVHCSHSELVVIFPAEKASSLCNATVRISISTALARLGLC